MEGLVIAETHPVQYHAPVYRSVVADHGVKVTAVYGSDFSVAGYRDAEFGASFAWDTDLLGGVENCFLSRVAKGGAGNYDAVRADGLEQMLKDCAPQAVMALGYAHVFDRAVLRAASGLKLPLLFRGETSDHAHQRGWLKNVVRDVMLRRLYALCAALLFVGERSRRHYERLGVPERKLFFSPYCVEAGTFQTTDADKAMMRAATRERLGIRDDAVVMLFSGKLSERKGVDLIPHAVRSLGEGRRVHVLFLGDGALRDSLEIECQCEPKVDVTFAGFQNQSALSAFYHTADMLVLPSRAKETWGLVVNEAMLHGLPCVVSEGVGSQSDLTLPGDTGEVCAPGCAESLGAAMGRLLARLSDSGLAGRCRDRVARYSVKAAAGGIAAAFQSVTGSRR